MRPTPPNPGSTSTPYLTSATHVASQWPTLMFFCILPCDRAVRLTLAQRRERVQEKIAAFKAGQSS